MSWFSDLAGKAESLLNDLDEQTGAALRNHHVYKQKQEKQDFSHQENYSQKKRPATKNYKKIPSATETRSIFNPTKKASPTSHQSRSQTKESPERNKNHPARLKKSPSRKSSPHYDLEHCPKTLVGTVPNQAMDRFGLKHRRFSLPPDLELVNQQSLTYKMQNLEVEKAMLKNELNVMNREVSELLDRLRKTEDGNNILVNNHKELDKTQTKLENTEVLNHRINLEKDSLVAQLEKLKLRIQELTTVEIKKIREKNKDLEIEVNLLRNTNKELEERLKVLNEQMTVKESVHNKLENDLRHAQSVIIDLQNGLEKSNEECRRLEKDWETYKLRVKSMLFAKDNEIKALQEGMNLTENTKLLIEQLDNLKEERAELSDAIHRIRGECGDMRRYVDELECRNSAAERVVTALRDALRDERAARNKAEAQCNALGKELKTIQIESGQTIASLRTALRDKDNELNHIKETASSIRTTDTSALNVADYDVMQDAVDNERIQYLTNALVQRQGKIEALLADNNILRIQLEKMESKYKLEVASARAKHSHSVVQFHDDSRTRSRTNRQIPESVLSTLSLRIGVAFKRYPIFRIFIILYMVCLHFWVLTVLLTRTPEDYTRKPIKT